MYQSRTKIFFLITLTILATNVFAQKELNVLVLHSYHQGLEWTDNINNGIQSVIDERNDIKLVFEYLDTKRNYKPEYFELLKELYHVKSMQIKFDAILVSDNAAFDFIRAHRDHLFKKIPVVFCGVNNFNPSATKGYDKFYGLIEKADHYKTLDAIKKLFPEKKNILIINDKTLTGKAISEELKPIKKMFEKEFNFSTISSFTLKSLKKKVKQLDETYAIYLLVVNRDSNNVFISYRNGIEAIRSVSNVPIFGSWDFYLGKGLIGGAITEGYQQGKHAAKLLLSILDSTIEQSNQHVFEVPSRYVFDFRELQKFNVPTSSLPKNSVLINKPNEATIPLKQTLIIISILVLLLSVSLLLLYFKRRNSRVLELQVKERTIKLQQLNSELKEANMKKNKFFSILAHDLRDFVSSMLNSTILLNNKEIKLTEQQRQRVISELFLNVRSTHHLLEDLFFWGANQFRKKSSNDFHDFNLVSTVENIADLYALNDQNISINIDAPEKILLKSDENICKFIIRNILQNALKFSKPDSYINIVLKNNDKDGEISITDYGKGMTQTVIQSIYNMSSERTASTSGKVSTGLGLNASIEYLDKIGGKLSIISTPGQGSTVTISFSHH